MTNSAGLELFVRTEFDCNYMENAAACSKRMLEQRVAMRR